jgi:hypothetical protein
MSKQSAQHVASYGVQALPAGRNLLAASWEAAAKAWYRMCEHV